MQIKLCLWCKKWDYVCANFESGRFIWEKIRQVCIELIYSSSVKNRKVLKIMLWREKKQKAVASQTGFWFSGPIGLLLLFWLNFYYLKEKQKQKQNHISKARIWLSFWRLAWRKLSVCVQSTHFTFLNIIQFL